MRRGHLSISFVTVLLTCSLAPVETWAATITVNDGGSILAAAGSVGENDTILVDSDQTFEELLYLPGLPAGVTIESAPGRNPVVQGNAALDWLTNIPVGVQGVLLFIQDTMTVRGVHFRMDLTGLPVITNPDTLFDEGYQVFRVSGGGTFLFEDCTFEFTGTVSELDPNVNRNMTRLEGATTSTFNRCTWTYNTNIIEWPTSNNTVGYFTPEEGTQTATFNDCVFGSVSEFSGKGRSIGASGGGGGNTILEINGCVFGRNRRFTNQIQQAWISPAIGGTSTTVRNSDFPSGASRFFGLEPNLEVLCEGCTFRQSFGQIFLPDPGGQTTRITCVNCAFTYVSWHLPAGITPFRGAEPEGDGSGRGYTFRHCTFTDLSGDRAESDPPDGQPPRSPALVNVADDSPEIEFTNCIFNVEGYTHHVVRNIDTPGNIPVGGIVASGNLMHSAAFPLTNEVIPQAAFVSHGDPLLAEDFIHLRSGSPAINATTSGESSDIDGEGRPDGADSDIGCDEFVGGGTVRPARVVTIPDDVATFAEALAMANGPGDEIVINSNGPFFETIRQSVAVSNLHVRAGEGFEPMFVADNQVDYLSEPSNSDSFAVAFSFSNNMTVDGIHFRLDLTDQEIIDFTNVLGSSIILLKMAGSDGHFNFNDCIFEVFGNADQGFEAVHGARQTVRQEGSTAANFNHCQWRFDMEILGWPKLGTNALGYFNPTPDGPDGGGTAVLELLVNDCEFQAMPDFSVNPRHIGAGGGGFGEVILDINRCTFGTDRDRLEEDDGNGGTFNRQMQQAFVYPATDTVLSTINDCTFLDGAERQFGADVNAARTGIFINRCVMEPTTVGFSLEPDPGGGVGFRLTNTVMRWDSRSKGDEGPFDAAVRGEAIGGDRGYAWVHCLLQDVAGEEGKPNVNIDNFSGITDGTSSLVNCIVDAPAMAEGLFENIDSPGQLPINTDNPTGSGNLLNTATLAFQILPESAIHARGDPALDGVDQYHLDGMFAPRHRSGRGRQRGG